MKIDIGKLAGIKLGKGSGGKHRCMMEAVAYITGEDRTDKPACVSPVLTTIGIWLNDHGTDEQRKRLIAYIPRVIGTAGRPDLDQKRAYICADVAVREYAPAALERSELHDQATLLRALPDIVDEATANAARDAATSAARSATSAAAVAAARAAANAATSDAVRAVANAAVAAANAATYVTDYSWDVVLALFDRLIAVDETPIADLGIETACEPHAVSFAVVA